jgi:hypothetical protein
VPNCKDCFDWPCHPLSIIDVRDPIQRSRDRIAARAELVDV